MKLYYIPGSCSLSPHIVIHELGLDVSLLKVDHRQHTVEGGGDYYGINPLGYVPILELEDGTRFREGPVIVQYLADRAPSAGILPEAGSVARARAQEWLNFIGTELHKGFSPLFTPGMPDEAKALAKTRLLSRLTWLDGELAGKQYLMGDDFSVADGYLFTVTNWAPRVGVDITGLAHLTAYRARVGARPGVQAAMKAEGLI